MRTKTSYRYYTLAKVGIAASYLWYVSDFFRVHRGLARGLTELLPPVGALASGDQGAWVGRAETVLSGDWAAWLFVLAAPLAMGLFLWGRRRWVQCGVGLWASLSMVALSLRGGPFISTADVWFHYAFLCYALAAAVQSRESWDAGEPGFEKARWKKDPAIASTFAWILIVLQATVYFFAGVSKLAFGWEPWVGGTAIQNLFYDSAMRGYVVGLAVPFWLSWVLCYVTLGQRLILPFFFFSKRWRTWAGLNIIAMHLGYAALMHVNAFPLIGISCLLLLMPVKGAVKKEPKAYGRAPKLAVLAFAAWLLLEPVRLVSFMPWRTEIRLMVAPLWVCFADGCVDSGFDWKVMLDVPGGRVDMTSRVRALLPQTWRDRFYIENVTHDLQYGRQGAGSPVERLAATGVRLYQEQQKSLGGDPSVLHSGLELVRLRP